MLAQRLATLGNAAHRDILEAMPDVTATELARECGCPNTGRDQARQQHHLRSS